MSKELALYDAHTDLVMARMRSLKVKDTDEPVAQQHIAKLIQAACTAKGVTMEPEGREITAALLVNQMRRDKIVADMTWEEVSKAIQDGVFGTYGQVYGINAASLWDMLWGYIESEERAELIRKERELRYGVEQKQRQKIEAFLEAHPAYAEIIRKNHIDNIKATRK